MSYIESSKNYTGTELETVFFRPMLTGPSALDLGIKVLYNMPVPTTIQVWTAQSDLLRNHTTTGWDATTKSTKSCKTVDMTRVKAEMGFSAADYYSIVFEDLSTQAEVNLDDLTGTELEKVETELFRRSLSESLRATMWIGDTTASSFKTFDGFLKKVDAARTAKTLSEFVYSISSFGSVSYVKTLFNSVWSNASEALKGSKADGELVYFVTSDIYNYYELALDAVGVDSSYVDSMNGRPTLTYHGIPVVNMQLDSYLPDTSFEQSFVMLTDRRNLVMAVNTVDFPGSEVRMWYNPDEMENRQRAIFAVGCEIVDPSAISFAYMPIVTDEE